MFQNLTRVMTRTSDVIVDTMDVLSINMSSLKAISEGGGVKAEAFKDACTADASVDGEKNQLAIDRAKYDVAKQRIDLDTKIKALTSTAKPKK
ncbi:hypothetical protein HN803_00020 [candidate division WWE3 bacterium]|nr:hypothetical protein [candidate division WWE3 bacterium]